jgi:hypothetical protein
MSTYKKQRALDKKRRRRQLKKKLGQPSFLGPDAGIYYYDLRGVEKMSEVLLRFIEPYMDLVTTDEALEKLVAVALVAWNAAMLSPDERETLIRKTEETLPAEIRADFRTVLDPLIARKQEHFSDYRRHIVSFDLASGPTGPRLNVLSLLEKPD